MERGLDRVAPVPEPTPAAVARAQVRRLEAFVKVAATQDAAWRALGAEADALLARARALADAAEAAPEPVEAPGPEPEATVAAPEPAEAVRAERGQDA